MPSSSLKWVKSMKKSFIKSFIISLFILIINSNSIEVTFTPLLPTVVSNVNLADYDISGNGMGAPIFSIYVVNNSNTASTNLKFNYKVILNEKSINQKEVYDGYSNTFSLDPFESAVVISNDFFKKNNPAVKFSLSYTVYELDDLSLKQKIFESQKLPDGSITYELYLLQNDSKIENDNIQIKIVNAVSIQLISPGSEATSRLPVLYDPHPLFIWTSELTPNLYGSEPVFELSLYEARSGESYSDAISRKPYISIKSTNIQERLPFAGPQIKPGTTYYWQVTGFLKGTSSTTIKSQVYGFYSQRKTNPRVQEIVDILRPIVDEKTLEQIYEYDIDVSIKINNKTGTSSDVQSVVNGILGGNNTIITNTVK
jgi:hypothetical protein